MEPRILTGIIFCSIATIAFLLLPLKKASEKGSFQLLDVVFVLAAVMLLYGVQYLLYAEVVFQSLPQSVLSLTITTGWFLCILLIKKLFYIPRVEDTKM